MTPPMTDAAARLRAIRAEVSRIDARRALVAHERMVRDLIDAILPLVERLEAAPRAHVERGELPPLIIEDESAPPAPNAAPGPERAHWDTLDWMAEANRLRMCVDVKDARVRELEAELEREATANDRINTALQTLTAERSEDGTLGARFNSLLDACYRFIGEEPDMYGAAPPEARVTAALERLKAERERGVAGVVVQKCYDPQGISWEPRQVREHTLYRVEVAFGSQSKVAFGQLPIGQPVLVIPLETKP